MQQTLGLIQNITVTGPKEFKHGPCYIHEYLVSDKVYTKFHKSQTAEFKVGDLVTIFYEEVSNGKYTTNRIKDMHIENSPPPTPPAAQVTTSTAHRSTQRSSMQPPKQYNGMADNRDQNTQERIARSHAITTALKAMEISDKHKGFDPHMIIQESMSIAEKVLQYTTGVPF